MPTGWRPKDVEEKFPLEIINDPKKQIKYETKNSTILIAWSWILLTITNILMFHFFISLSTDNSIQNYLYAFILILNIFSFTSLLDQRRYSIIAESIKVILVFSLFYYQRFSWYGLEGLFAYIVGIYFITSFILNVFFYNEKNTNTTVAKTAI